MPPRQKYTPADVIEAAFQIVRRNGWEGLSARAIAKVLDSSTRPVYDYFQSMKNIEKQVVKKALAYFVDYIGRERTGDRWLDQAMGYILFAANEKHLFSCINDEAHIGYQKEFAKKHWLALAEQLSEDERFKDLTAEAIHRIRVARWFLVHGISYLACNGWSQFSEDENATDTGGLLGMSLKAFLNKANMAIYEGFKD